MGDAEATAPPEVQAAEEDLSDLKAPSPSATTPGEVEDTVELSKFDNFKISELHKNCLKIFLLLT